LRLLEIGRAGRNVLTGEDRRERKAGIYLTTRWIIWGRQTRIRKMDFETGRDFVLPNVRTQEGRTLRIYLNDIIFMVLQIEQLH
jgi:hypothetical protein